MRPLHVYVLISLKDNQFYIGTTTDVARRFQQHKVGQNISTKSRRPLKLIYVESFINPRDAARRERYFKTTKGRTTLNIMLRHFLENFRAT